MSMTGTIVPF